jgi:hypothetical protein
MEDAVLMSSSFSKDTDHIVRSDDVIESDLLTGGELAALSVNERIFELLRQSPVDLMTYMLNGSTFTDDERIRKIRTLASFLSINSIHPELFPHNVLEVVQI